MPKQQTPDSTKTILTITVGFMVLYLISKKDWTLYAAFSVGLAGLLSTYLREKMAFLWMKLAWLLSLFVPNILLSLVFFLFLFPVALLSRLFGKKDALGLKNTSASLFKTSSRTIDKSFFEKPW